MGIMRTQWPFIVVGSGIAGLSAARVMADVGPVLVVTKGPIRTSATQWAQGGIAVVMHSDDQPLYHFTDTIKAGDGLCNPEAVQVLVQEGPQRVAELIQLGAQFDRDTDGYSLTQEAAHSKRRILHAGDSTGKEIEKTLGNALLRHPNVTFLDHTTVTELLMADGECVGIAVMPSNQVGEPRCIYANAVVLATGGCAQVYHRNTNPSVATGDGIALAYQAGATIQDMEMIQFHPTTLYVGESDSTSSFLISESVRGEGGYLLNQDGQRWLLGCHPDAELAPRDWVARAIFSEMTSSGSSFVWLDLSHVPLDLPTRFPTIFKRCLENGVDMRRQPIPVTPAAHYVMGGVWTDLSAQTSIPRLLAAGECACVGVHGANRLASNSLLDGLVFGCRAGEVAKEWVSHAHRPVRHKRWGCQSRESTLVRRQLRHMMWEKVGIQRDEVGLLDAIQTIEEWLTVVGGLDFETYAMLQVSDLIARSALSRTESRGGHYRIDYPHSNAVAAHTRLIAGKNPVFSTTPL